MESRVIQGQNQPARVAVLDYGSGNLRSVSRALIAAGADAFVTADLEKASAADGLVIPGVGAFAACVNALRACGADEFITDRVRSGQPILGICVGMQVLFEYGDEHGEIATGLGILPGTVHKLNAQRLPHMGWNTVRAPAESRLFAGVVSDTRFYFVHSYAASESVGLVTSCDYGGGFVAAVEHGCVTATQFHPEKSGVAGAHIVRNWVEGIHEGISTDVVDTATGC